MWSTIKSYLKSTAFTLAVVIFGAIVFPPNAWLKPLPYKYGELPVGHTGDSPIVRLWDSVQGESCTAFIIDKHYAITAGHCVSTLGWLKPYHLYIMYNNSDVKYEVVPMGFYKDPDSALLYGDFNYTRIVPNFKTNDFRDDVPLIACGYARGQKEFVCNVFEYERNSYEQIVGISKFFHGMSGGPIINMLTGEAVGIAVAMDEDESYVTSLQGLLGLYPGLEK